MAIRDSEFFARDCLQVAQELVGKVLVRRLPSGEILRMRISQTECYCGEADTACHAHKGRTKRTEMMYAKAGTMYIYLCYGMHWMLNIVTGLEGAPEAVLIRACVDADGPGKLTKALSVTGALNGQSVLSRDALWVEDDAMACTITAAKRVGIGYASQEDQNKLWRFILQ